MRQFKIIQGGMGVGVSGWPLARAVSRLGQLGVVSGTGLAVVLARRLQQGDLDGHVRRACGAFPVPGVAKRVLDRYFVDGGKPTDKPFLSTPSPKLPLSAAFNELTVLANFVEVYLAKEGHDGAVGVNYLEKLQIPTVPSLFGAMLAGVDCVLMGAGIPRSIPGILDALSVGQPVEMKIDVVGAAAGESNVARFDPAMLFEGTVPEVRRPDFLAIVSSDTLALTLARKSNGRVDGFVIEGPSAGGHNAPPRGPAQLSERGEPVYGPRDTVDLTRFRELGLPFWLAGGYGKAGGLAAALAEGAQGIQVGTAFAFCEESGLTDELKAQVIDASRAGVASVFTDPRASPTGYPFKVMPLEGTLGTPRPSDSMPRRCDVGYLRHAYRRDDGTVGYRCPAEAAEQYTAKGGLAAETVGRKCICNALFAAIGMGQVRSDGELEDPVVTAGDDVAQTANYLKPGRVTYTAAEVVERLLASSV